MISFRNISYDILLKYNISYGNIMLRYRREIKFYDSFRNVSYDILLKYSAVISYRNIML